MWLDQIRKESFKSKNRQIWLIIPWSEDELDRISPLNIELKQQPRKILNITFAG